MTRKNTDKRVTEKSLSNLNRRGRPPGAKNNSTLFKEAMKQGFEQLLLKEGEKVFMVVVEKAKEGDMTAAKMILDRIVPVAKSIDVNATDIASAGGITIHIESLTASTGRIGDTIEDGEIIEE